MNIIKNIKSYVGSHHGIGMLVVLVILVDAVIIAFHYVPINPLVKKYFLPVCTVMFFGTWGIAKYFDYKNTHK